MNTDSTGRSEYTGRSEDAGQTAPQPRDIIEKHGRSFALAARMLPSEVRRDVERLYAWCRWCDDAVDECATPEEGARRFEVIRQDVQAIFAGGAIQATPSAWLAELVERHRLPRSIIEDFLRGMQQDLAGERLRTESELDQYCYRVAGTVGMLMAHLLGVRDLRALQAAKALGMAMQLTNIARDVGEDAERGRCYVPSTWNACSFVSTIEREGRSQVSAFEREQARQVTLRLVSRAEEYYAVGWQGLRELPDAVRPAIRSAGLIYRAIGLRAIRSSASVLTHRCVVPRYAKLLLLLRSRAEEFAFRCRRSWQQLAASGGALKDISRSHDFPSASYLTGGSTMPENTRYLVSLGLALTLIMATALFALVGINPKQASYDSLPWIYAAVSALCAALFYFDARRVSQREQVAQGGRRPGHSESTNQLQ